MTLFQYPKSKHNRSLTPRKFKRYKSYKRYLQAEFSRVCVYCRQPDSSAPNINFGVDHYRPKGLTRFASLICDYDNLYYCCGACNSRKTDDWPVDEKAGPYVVNPCEHEMASHLRFDAKTGRVEPRGQNGMHTEKLLQLNDEATVKYRRGALTTVRLIQAEIANENRLLKAIEASLRKGKLTQSQYEAEAREVNERLDLLRHTMLAQTGELPVPMLPRQRNGLRLV